MPCTHTATASAGAVGQARPDATVPPVIVVPCTRHPLPRRRARWLVVVSGFGVGTRLGTRETVRTDIRLAVPLGSRHAHPVVARGLMPEDWFTLETPTPKHGEETVLILSLETVCWAAELSNRGLVMSTLSHLNVLICFGGIEPGSIPVAG